MRQLASNLISKGVKPENILMINKEFESFSFVETYKDLDMLISAYEKKYCPQGRIYIFIDEIQEIEGWEKVVNSYSHPRYTFNPLKFSDLNQVAVFSSGQNRVRLYRINLYFSCISQEK